ncbi:Glucose-1-phosphate adenylyltransferase large subunit 2, chloroplastic [Apostasia shenzhenica]|uniref:glucose-1-phosphate adenylyltransferase n=1 Tax=Apostasia shenzhenica TaxID=1088818 RepID=A0A2H9ZV98_9ASPA|nr:Glucose-1-phosphate adenylyltransferase large subunit 2, chloroplastic [Apostasia shenzhenica]
MDGRRSAASFLISNFALFSELTGEDWIPMEAASFALKPHSRATRARKERSLGSAGNGFKIWVKPWSRKERSRAGTIVSIMTSDVNKEATLFQPPMFTRRRAEPKNVASIILGGGAGAELFPLTSTRATPAVPIGGCYRLIDIPMSNCINSGINKIFIMTQFNSASLNRHIARTYNFSNGINFGDGFVEVLAATQTPGEAGMNWFQGTADAVRQFIWVFEDYRNKDIEHVLILCGDHLYRMDYMDFVQAWNKASDYGLIKIDKAGRIIEFSEKPKGKELESMKVDTTLVRLSCTEAMKYPYIASMGVYVFRRDILLKLLRWRYPTSNDFGSDILPAVVHEHKVQAYLFNDYWEDIGKLKSFFNANLAFTDQIVDAIVSHGCFLRECSVQHSIVGVRSRLDYGVDLKDTVMMGADTYETEAEIAFLLAEGKVPMGVGENAEIRNCIIDMNARIGKNVIIENKDGVIEANRPGEGYCIREGITVVLKNATIKDKTINNNLPALAKASRKVSVRFTAPPRPPSLTATHPSAPSQPRRSRQPPATPLGAQRLRFLRSLRSAYSRALCDRTGRRLEPARMGSASKDSVIRRRRPRPLPPLRARHYRGPFASATITSLSAGYRQRPILSPFASAAAAWCAALIASCHRQSVRPMFIDLLSCLCSCAGSVATTYHCCPRFSTPGIPETLTLFLECS